MEINKLWADTFAAQVTMQSGSGGDMWERVCIVCGVTGWVSMHAVSHSVFFYRCVRCQSMWSFDTSNGIINS